MEHNKVYIESLMELRRLMDLGEYSQVIIKAKEVYGYGKKHHCGDCFKIGCQYLCDSYYALGNMSKCIKWGSKLLEKIDYEEDEYHIVAFEFLALAFFEYEDYSNVESIYEKILESKRVEINMRAASQNYINYIHVLNQLGKTEKAMEIAKKAYQAIENTKDIKDELKFYLDVNLLESYSLEGEFEKAKAIKDKYEKNVLAIKSNNSRYFLTHSLIVYFRELNNLSMAKEMAIEGYHIAKELNNPIYQKEMLKKILDFKDHVLSVEEKIIFLNEYYFLVESKESLEAKKAGLQLYDAYFSFLERQKNGKDELTRVRSRTYANRYLLEWDKYENFSCIMFDIDYFKEVNDTFGHVAGDEVIVQVAEISNSLVKDYGFVSRYGGDEFLCVLFNQQLNIVKDIAEGIRKGVEEFFKEEQYKVTLSLGVSDKTHHKIYNSGQFIKLADEGLYRAKELGKNRVELV